MKEVRLALVGFGNVGKALVQLLDAKRNILNQEFDFNPKVIGIATGRHGMAINPIGLDTQKAISLSESGKNLDSLSTVLQPKSIIEFIQNCQADVFFENSPVNHQTGQPAIDHIKTALQSGLHAITANKGPVAHAYKELTTMAVKNQRRFLYESAVMDGAPIFSLFRGPLPAVEIKGFQGILNSCTNLLIELMEQGKDFEEAVDYGKSIGITETDPAADIDGWDAAIKVSALCNVLMGESVTPNQVKRTGISGLTPEMIKQALIAGERWKLVCSAKRTAQGLDTCVEPQRVTPNNPLFSVNGTSSFIQFELDTLPGLGILESNPGPKTTAYGLLADLINVMRGA
ncbi:MAG: homoserine dehydrogenase [Chloroflexi bacterium HGW-Chloroflexi-4]|jgi:homoserine dehydrogenase|nr:MAG: homoserine dehydrogenase [Chloroflexi bacterium HGW-Chloroflexi-4]